MLEELAIAVLGYVAIDQYCKKLERDEKEWKRHPVEPYKTQAERDQEEMDLFYEGIERRKRAAGN